MSRIVFVNGEYVKEEHAQISIFDRGLLMADAVYEVTSVLQSRLIDFEGHVQRLLRSLSELDIPLPMPTEDLRKMHERLVKDNYLNEGGIYLQVTRGAYERDFAWPDQLSPNIFAFTQEKSLIDSPAGKNGIKVISIDDIRWGRRDIKTTQLLYPSLGKMMAKAAQADDAWMIQDGYITEGTSNNAHIIKDGVIITRPPSHDILKGITQTAIKKLAEELQIKIELRAFTLDEAKAADEAFITSATTFVHPVIAIDDHPIGSGKPGAITQRLREIYIETALQAHMT